MRVSSVVNTEVAISDEVQSEFAAIQSVADGIEQVKKLVDEGSVLLGLTNEELNDLVEVANAGAVINGISAEAISVDANEGASASVDANGKITLHIPRGKDGLDGTDGVSVSVNSIVNMADGRIKLEFSDGTTHITDVLKGKQGDEGRIGPQGERGDIGNTGLTMTYEFEIDEDGNLVYEETIAKIPYDEVEKYIVYNEYINGTEVD